MDDRKHRPWTFILKGKATEVDLLQKCFLTWTTYFCKLKKKKVNCKSCIYIKGCLLELAFCLP